MKIAVFSDTFTPQVNGVAKTLQRLKEYMNDHEIECRFFVPEASKEDSAAPSVNQFTSIPFFLYPECRIAIPNFLQIKKQIEEFQPDLIHIATPFNIGLAGRYYGKKLNIPMVASYHTHFDRYLEYYDLQFLSNSIWKYMRWFHQPFIKTFVPSQETKYELMRKGFTNLHLWRRGVDATIFHPRYPQDRMRARYEIESDYVLTYVGRLAPEKDLDVLMEIAYQLPDPIKNKVHWLIVGDGPLKEELQQTKTTNMTFTGYLESDRLAEVYSGSDLLVFPSKTETFGNVVLESFACGTPVIGAQAGGVKEIISHEQNGILCPSGQTDTFIEAIVNLLCDKDSLRMYGTRARTYAQSQSWEKIFDQLMDDYQDAIYEQQDRRYA
ncbi:glycosyltransferase family 1 protein [Mesobacillus maritimus]|uniref:glycosyltransferase family 4 protein n=1 Tax=Mesobacillus maritimus TaxID=1643336 RepID=UPI00203EFBD7|nr:glycosyltransferase family 1 protein [Mesobacillus maritimus]